MSVVVNHVDQILWVNIPVHQIPCALTIFTGWWGVSRLWPVACLSDLREVFPFFACGGACSLLPVGSSPTTLLKRSLAPRFWPETDVIPGAFAVRAGAIVVLLPFLEWRGTTCSRYTCQMMTKRRKIELWHTLRLATRHQSFLLSHGDLLLSVVLLHEMSSSLVTGGFLLLCALLFLFLSFFHILFSLDNFRIPANP